MNENEDRFDEIETVENAKIEDYSHTPREKHRPPSKGGMTRALHSHAIKIDGVWYSWLGLGTQQWVFKTDTVSFDWQWDETRKFRNVDKASIRTLDKSGEPVRRGNRGTKPQLRTATTRLPARRSEWKD